MTALAAHHMPALRALLTQHFDSINDAPRISAPVLAIAATHDVVVPIEQLLYRGRAALTRAAEIRDDIRARGTAAPELLDELFALLDLALVE